MRRVVQLYREAFSGVPRPVWHLALGLFANRAGSMVLPFLSLYVVEQRGFSTTQAGTVLFAFGLGSVAGAWAGGKAADRLGPVRTQRLSLIAAGLGFVVLSQLRTFETLVAGAFVVSALNDAYRPACMTATIRYTPPALHVRALAAIRLAANLGVAVGPALGGVLASIDYLWLFVGDGVTCWLAAVVLFVALREVPETESSSEPAGGDGTAATPWRDGRFLTLLAIVFVMALALFQVFNALPLHLSRDHGLDERRIGLLFAWNAALIVAFEMVLVRMLERRDGALVLGAGGFLMCAGFAILPFGSGMAVALAAFTVLTVGEMLSLPFSNGLVARLAGPRSSGAYMGWYNVTFSAALVLAPVVGLTVLDRFGPTVLWLGTGLCGVPVWIASILLSRRLAATCPGSPRSGR